MAKRRKKSKYKHAVINKNRYYFYSIRWLDITGDAGHATVMVTQAYVYKKDNKFLWTFASYDEKEEVFSDRNVFPKGCIIKMEKVKI